MKAPKGHESIAGGQRSAAPGTIAERSSRPKGAPAQGNRGVLSNPKGGCGEHREREQQTYDLAQW